MKKIIFSIIFLSACLYTNIGLAKTVFIEKYSGHIYAKEGEWPTSSDTLYDNISDVIERMCEDGDTLIIGGGPNMQEKQYIANDISLNGGILLNRRLNIRGTCNTDPEFRIHGGSVIFSGEGDADYIIYIDSGAQDSTVSHLQFINELTGPAIYLRNSAVIQDIKISNCKYGIFSCNDTQIVRTEIKDCDNYCLKLQGTENIYYSSFRGGKGLLITTNAMPVVNNCLIAGQSPYSVILTSGSHVQINNSIIVANGSYWYNEYVIKNQISSTATLDHCLILPSPYETDKYYYAPDNIVELDCIHESPGFRKSRRPAIVIFGSDDRGNLPYFNEIITPALEQYGWKGVMAYNSPSHASQNDWDIMRTLIKNGHQIANHAEMYSRNVQDHRGITIYYDSDATAIIDIQITDTDHDGYADNMIFRKSGEFDSTINGTGVIDFNINEFNRIGKICDYLNKSDIEGYYCTLRGEYTAGSRYLPDLITTAVLPEGLALDLDSERVWNGELRDPKAIFEQHLGPGYKMTGWVGPGNGTSSEMREKLMEFGYLGGRGGYPDRGSITLESFNVYNFFTHALGGIAKTNHPSSYDIKARWGAKFEWLKYHGGILYFYAHKLSEFDDSAWQNLLSEVNEAQLSVMTLDQAANFVRTYNPAGDLSTEDGKTFTRSMTGEGDFHFLWSSSCLNGGTSVSGLHDNVDLAYDLDGTAIENQPDIGPYEYPYALGDYDWDGDTDGWDLVKFINFFSEYNFYADINNDQTIDMDDLLKLTSHFGQ